MEEIFGPGWLNRTIDKLRNAGDVVEGGDVGDIVGRGHAVARQIRVGINKFVKFSSDRERDLLELVLIAHMQIHRHTRTVKRKKQPPKRVAGGVLLGWEVGLPMDR